MSARAAAIALLLLLAAIALVPAPAATAAAPPVPALHLLALSTAIEPGADIVARVQAVAAPADAQLRVAVYSRTRTRSGFQQTLGAKALGSELGSPVIVPATPDADGGISTTIHTTGSDEPVIAVADEGVFPLTFTLTTATGATLAQLLTYVVRLPSAADTVPLGIATIVPLRAAPALQPDGSIVVDAQARDRLLSTAGAISARPSTPVTIDATPETLASFAAAGDTAVTTAVARAATGSQVVAAPLADIDVGSWVTSNLGHELGRELDAGSNALIAAGITPSTTTYVSARPLTTDAVAALRDRGFQNFVVPDQDLSPLDGRRFPAALTQPFRIAGADGVTAAAADPGLAHHTQDSDDPLVAANHLLADLAILFFDQPKVSRVAVLALPDDVSTAMLAATLDGIHAMRVVHATTLDSAFASVPVVGTRGEADGHADPLVRTITTSAPTSLGSLPDQLRAAEADLSTYAGALDPTDTHATALVPRLLVAGDRSLDGTQQRRYLDAVSSTARGELQKVSLPSRQSITFTAHDGVVSFGIRNDTGYPVHVLVHLDGTKLQFPQHPDGTMDLTLTDATTRLEVNVHTLASGDSPLDVTVTTPDGRIELGRTRVTIRSTAFSGVGIVLSVGAGLFLVIWWGRHIAETRRASRQRLRHSVGTRGRAEG